MSGSRAGKIYAYRVSSSACRFGSDRPQASRIPNRLDAIHAAVDARSTLSPSTNGICRRYVMWAEGARQPANGTSADGTDCVNLGHAGQRTYPALS